MINFLRTLDAKDRTILELRMKDYTYKDIAKRVGYENHSGVIKQINEIMAKFTHESRPESKKLLKNWAKTRPECQDYLKNWAFHPCENIITSASLQEYHRSSQRRLEYHAR